MKTRADRAFALGIAIYDRRKLRGLTQKVVAEEIGCTQTTILNLENGKRAAQPETYAAACAWAGVVEPETTQLSHFVRETLPTCGDAKKRPVILTGNGDPVGVLISPEVFEALEVEIRAVYLTYGTT